MVAEDFYKKFKNYIVSQRPAGIKIPVHMVAGVSGGADSVCLLLLLKQFAQETDGGITAVHVNHMLRGEDADRDQRFVEELCKKLCIELDVYKEDIKATALKENLSTEEAGRNVRYRCFAKTANRFDNAVIATAHHMEDNAETILFNIIRGTDITGLAGIKPVSYIGKHTIIRPLLFAGRNDVEQFLESKGQTFVTDDTNADDSFSRNRIRLNILPEMKKINAAAASHIINMADAVKKAEDYIEKNTKTDYLRLVSEYKDKIIIDEKGLALLDDIEISRIIYRAVVKISGEKKDIGHRHIEQVCSLLHKPCGKCINLRKGVIAEKTYEGIILKHADDSTDSAGTRNCPQEKNRLFVPLKHGVNPYKEKSPFPNSQEVFVSEAETKHCDVGLDGMNISFEVTDADSENFCDLMKHCNVELDGMNISLEVTDVDSENFCDLIKKNVYTKAFDYDKIRGGLFFGYRNAGDVISIKGGKKSLQRFFIDNKIPSEKRDKILIVKDEDEVIWIVGYRISEKYKLNENTVKALKISVNGGYDGRY